MYNGNRVNCIVQARMTSSRLPGKVLLPLIGKPVLQHIIERLRRSKYIDDVIIACTTNSADNAIVELCESLECKYYRGSEDNVLERVLFAAREFNTDIIVDITSDCPCCDWDTIDKMIEMLKDNDYISNVIERTMPRGLDTQVLWMKTLETTYKDVDNDVDRQHVTSWIYKNPKNFLFFVNESYELDDLDLSSIRLTLDMNEDYQFIKFIYEAFESNMFDMRDIYQLLLSYPELPLLNSHIQQKSYYKELAMAYEEV